MTHPFSEPLSPFFGWNFLSSRNQLVHQNAHIADLDTKRNPERTHRSRHVDVEQFSHTAICQLVAQFVKSL
jgi:hypothetical protein